MAYDKNGNYIPTKQDKANEKARKENREFTKRMGEFLRKHEISGIACTYGFATTNPDIASEKLKKLGVKFKLDYTPIFHTKVVIGKNGI